MLQSVITVVSGGWESSRTHHVNPLRKGCFISIGIYRCSADGKTHRAESILYLFQLKKTALCFAVSCFYLNLHPDLNGIYNSRVAAWLYFFEI